METEFFKNEAYVKSFGKCEHSTSGTQLCASDILNCANEVINGGILDSGILYSVTLENGPDVHPQCSPQRYMDANVSISCVIPTPKPTKIPTNVPSDIPTKLPSVIPTQQPSDYPSIIPTKQPSNNPTMMPTNMPSVNPTLLTLNPTKIPTKSPTICDEYLNIDGIGTHLINVQSNNDSTMQQVCITFDDKYRCYNPKIEINYINIGHELNIKYYKNNNIMKSFNACSGDVLCNTYQCVSEDISDDYWSNLNSYIIQLKSTLNEITCNLTDITLNANITVICDNSNQPTFNPTNIPTILPTSLPTILPTTNPTLIQSTTIQATHKPKNASIIATMLSNPTTLIVAVSIIVVICLLIVCFIVLCAYKMGKKKAIMIQKKTMTTYIGSEMSPVHDATTNGAANGHFRVGSASNITPGGDVLPSINSTAKVIQMQKLILKSTRSQRNIEGLLYCILT